jgi:hypothetical protein
MSTHPFAHARPTTRTSPLPCLRCCGVLRRIALPCAGALRQSPTALPSWRQHSNQREGNSGHQTRRARTAVRIFPSSCSLLRALCVASSVGYCCAALLLLQLLSAAVGWPSPWPLAARGTGAELMGRSHGRRTKAKHTRQQRQQKRAHSTVALALAAGAILSERIVTRDSHAAGARLEASTASAPKHRRATQECFNFAQRRRITIWP